MQKMLQGPVNAAFNKRMLQVDTFSILTELSNTSDDGNSKVLGLKGNYRGQTLT